MLHRYLLLALTLGILVGCGKKSPTDEVIYVADDDAKMNAAIAQGKATVKSFIAALQSPKKTQHGFSVKKRFGDAKQGEHMWLAPVTYDGKSFQGTVSNQPAKVPNVKMGQKVSVDPTEISDWMYIENGKLIGGYTIRVLRDGLSAEKKAAFDKDIPFTID